MGLVGVRLEPGTYIARLRFFYHPVIPLLSDEDMGSVETLRKYLHRYKKSRRASNQIKQPRFDLRNNQAMSIFVGDLEMSCFPDGPAEVSIGILSPKPTRVTHVAGNAVSPLVKERYSLIYGKNYKY